MWTSCNASALETSSNLTLIRDLETSCLPLLASRLFFYSSFLLLSLFLFFSFVRHHVKYGRSDVMCIGIETERHRVVLALCIGTFMRSLSFVVSEEYMRTETMEHHLSLPGLFHIVLRLIKDICYVQAFSLVVVFWLTLLKTVNGTDVRSPNRCDPSKLQLIAVITFAVCRTGIAILRLVYLDPDVDVSVLLFGILSVLYFFMFVVGLMHGYRLHARLKRVGLVVRKNLLRLRMFIVAEVVFTISLALSTMLRVVLFSILGYNSGQHLTLYFTIRTIVKGAELGLVATLTLLMIARTKGRSDKKPRNSSKEHSSQRTSVSSVDVNEEWKTRSPNDHQSFDTSTFDDLPNPPTPSRSNTDEGALFDRRSFHLDSQSSQSFNDIEFVKSKDVDVCIPGTEDGNDRVTNDLLTHKQNK